MFPSSSDTAENSNDIVFIDKDDISNYNPEQILPLSPEIIAKIRCWLQPTAYDSESGEYRKHLASHAHGTSTWVTSHSTYLDWLQSTEAGTLWIKGIPGSGKSVLTSHVVHELALEHPGVPVLYFFFRQIVNANHHPISLLRDWVDQVLVYSPPLQHHLEAHLKTRRSLDTLSMNDLWDVLRLALKSLPKGAYCIVDALDEMDGGNEVFLRALADLGEWMPESLKVMVTSRPVPSIEAMLRPFKTLQIRLNELDVDRDIVTFVQRKLDSTHITGSDRQLILDAVPGRANGLFLFAKLAMDSILEPGANISAVLESLPANLDDMYTKLLQYQADSSGVPEDIQRLVLQCATHAPRPLRCLELADMIEIVHFSKNVNDRDAMVAKDLVRTACGPLLEIIADETVRVVHHSLTEYLIGTTRADKPVGYPILKHDATHATLALSCLAYLEAVCRASTKGGESSHRNHPKWTFEQSARYPFFEYAATNWSWHVVKSGASQLYQKEVIEATHQFFQETEQRKMWLRFKWSSVFEYVEGIPPLYIATRLGIEAYVRELLTDSNRLDVDVDVQDAWGRTPLWWAASLGHTSILRLLVAEGANPDHADHHNGLKPLHEAVAHNHVQVVKILLEVGVNPMTGKTREDHGSGRAHCGTNRSSTIGSSALQYACHAGNPDIVETFLPFLEDIDTVQQALAWAACRGNAEAIRIITQHPDVDVNAKVHGQTALYLACESGIPEAIAALLKSGADPNILGKKGYKEQRPVWGGSPAQCSPLHKLCGVGEMQLPFELRRNYEEILATAASHLIDAGACVDEKDDSGRTALHLCMKNCLLTRTLLDAGADANATDSDGDAPLHKIPRAAVIRVLIEVGGADVNKRGKDGKTPLLCILGKSGSLDAISTLLEYGADHNAVDLKKNGALHTALTAHISIAERRIVLQTLLDTGADPNAKDADGNPPFHLLDQDIEALDLFLAAGADINAKDRNGATLLFKMNSPTAYNVPNRNYVAYLLERGAWLQERDFEGRTVLHEVVRSLPGLRNLLEYLLTLGLDVHSLDYRGNNLLHELALICHCKGFHRVVRPIACLQYLLSLGLDITQSNHHGRTPLHILCSTARRNESNDWLATVEFVIQATKGSRHGTVDLFDYDGLTPLHIAATSSPQVVQMLLKAGANPAARANDGLTPLHLAARARESNIVGMIIDAIFLGQSDSISQVTKTTTEDGKSLRPGFWYRTTTHTKIPTDIDAKDDSGQTPLTYACRSGRPESVDLLLRAGASITVGRPFQACAEFGSEQTLWDIHDARHNTVGLTISDLSRPYESYSDYDSHLRTRTARIDDILEMLTSHPSATEALEEISSIDQWILLHQSFRRRDDYTASCLLSVFMKQERTTPAFAKLHTDHRQQSSIQLVTSFDTWKTLPPYEIFFESMCRREYGLVKEFYRKGAFSNPIPRHDFASHFATLVKYGFSSLARSIVFLHKEVAAYESDGTSEKETLVSRIKAILQLERYVPSRKVKDHLILMALRRELPNMDMLKLLIHDVVAESLIHAMSIREAVDNALLLAVKGGHWWYAALAVPYLIENSANVNCRNEKGQTPLHVALESVGSGFSGYDIIRALLDAGADANAVDGEGRSCLSYAGSDASLVRILAGQGERIGPDALLSAIDAGNDDTLQFLLLAGASPNIPYVSRDPDPSNRDSYARHQRLCGLGFMGRPEHELYPLFYAATPYVAVLKDKSVEYKEAWKQARIRLVTTLMSHGADPLQTFSWSSADAQLAVATAATQGVLVQRQEHDQTEILHEIVRRSGLFWPVWNAQSGDPNRRDAHGRTLFLAACMSSKGPDTAMEDLGAPSDVGKLSILKYLLSVGADPRAKDLRHRNALHCMIQDPSAYYRNNEEVRLFKDSLLFMATTFPDLVNQQDDLGRTPLYTAIEYAINRSVNFHVEPACILLEKAGADPSIPDKDGNFCLHVLAQSIVTSQMADLLRGVVRHGCDINVRNQRSETPMFWLFQESENNGGLPLHGYGGLPLHGYDYIRAADCVALFESLGADMHARDARGRNLLHLAAEVSGARYLFKALLDKGVDPLVEDDEQRTPIDVAAAYKNVQVLALLDRKEGDELVEESDEESDEEWDEEWDL